MHEIGNVVVTGAASGLGLAVAEAVEKAGGRALTIDVREPADAIADVSDASAVQAAIESLASRAGSLDGVVTAAGIDACGPLERVDAARWDQVVRVNLLGTAAVVRAALPLLLASHGRIVTVASTLGLRALPDATAYCASKFGVVGFTRALALELAGRVGVTLLIPGGMDTSFFAGRDAQYMPGPDAQLNAPADVASAVVFALSQPQGCEVRELIVTPSTEPSWP